MREVEAGTGLTRLPAPSPGDVFLDLEGDSFAREGGMIALVADKSRIVFVANPKAAQAAGLAIGAQLLSLAKAVER